MKMSDNTLGAVKEYFNVQLATIFGEREVEQFFVIAAYHFLKYEKYELRLRENERLSESQLLEFVYCVKDLKKNKPIQYIFGTAPFYGLDFSVDENVLIPRPETEELVEWIQEENKDKGEISILDIGTGSGCIAIALKKHLSAAKVTAMDISKGALALAQKNADDNETEIEFVEADVLSHPKWTRKLDVIVSNPPYIAKSEAISMHKNVLDYEPHLALFVDNNDELLFYKEIAKWGLEHLSKNGAIYFELNERNGDELALYLRDLGYDCLIKKDLSNKNRMMKLILK